jgi:hypothetical protein
MFAVPVERDAAVKKSLWVVVPVVCLAGVGIWMLLSNLNAIVARAIESEGSKVTETHVGVAGVDIKLRDGRGAIESLTIASPSGYQADNVFSLGEITLGIDLKSVRQDPVVLDEVRITAPEVFAEFNEKGGSNLDEIRKRVQGYAKLSGATGDGGGGGGGQAKQPKLRIRNFVVEQGRISVDASALGLEQRDIVLPEIRLTDLGGAAGDTPDRIARDVILAVAKQVTRSLAQSEVQGQIEKQLGGELGDKAKGLLDRITR